jgi:hypothetical protein
MKTPILLSALTASPAVWATFVPVHGCEWVKETTPLDTFTFFLSASNTSTPDYITWHVPAHGFTCRASNPSSTGAAVSIGHPGTRTTVPCDGYSKDAIPASFLVSEDDAGKNATLTFTAYVGCAADIFEFDYRADFPLVCEESAAGSETCVAKGNITANVVAEIYLPPIRNPPPPSWTPPRTGQ